MIRSIKDGDRHITSPQPTLGINTADIPHYL